MFPDFTLLAIASAFIAAITNILARALLKDSQSRKILVVNFLITFIICALLSPFYYKFHFSAKSIALIILISSIDTVANFFYFKIFEKTEASIAMPILSLSPIFTFFAGWLFLNDIVSLKTYFIAAFIIILVIIFSADFKNFQRFKMDTLIPALVVAMLFGISAIPSKMLLTETNIINPPTFFMVRIGFISFFSLLFFGAPAENLSLKKYWIISFRALLTVGQVILYYYALSLGNAGVVGTLSNSASIFAFILGIIFLHEKPTWKKAITAILVLTLSFII